MVRGHREGTNPPEIDLQVEGHFRMKLVYRLLSEDLIERGGDSVAKEESGAEERPLRPLEALCRRIQVVRGLKEIDPQHARMLQARATSKRKRDCGRQAALALDAQSTCRTATPRAEISVDAAPSSEVILRSGFLPVHASTPRGSLPGEARRIVRKRVPADRCRAGACPPCSAWGKISWISR